MVYFFGFIDHLKMFHGYLYIQDVQITPYNLFRTRNRAISTKKIIKNNIPRRRVVFEENEKEKV